MSTNSVMRQISTRVFNTLKLNMDKYVIDNKLYLGRLIRDNGFSGCCINGVLFLKNIHFFKIINREDYYRKDRGMSYCKNINNIRTIGNMYKWKYGNTLRRKMIYRSSFYKDTVEDIRY